jgi:hypothetical protein
MLSTIYGALMVPKLAATENIEEKLMSISGIVGDHWVCSPTLSLLHHQSPLTKMLNIVRKFGKLLEIEFPTP